MKTVEVTRKINLCPPYRSENIPHINSRPRMDFRRLVVFFFLVGMLGVATTDAFVSSRETTWLHLRAPLNRSISRPLFATAKSGGKMIVTEEMFRKNVLSADIPRPVLVFFSAPW